MNAGSVPEAKLLLPGLRVLDLSGNLAGIYASRLLVDSGAEVSRPADLPVELGDPGTGRNPAVELDLLALMQRGVHKVALGDLEGLLDVVDLVIESDAMDLDRSSLLARRPDLVLVTITDFGLTGPLGGQRSGSALRQAISGSTYWRGMPDAAPVMAGGEVEQFFAGTYAMAVALASLRRAREIGVGDHLDVSVTEAANLGLTTFGATHASLSGALGTKFPSRSVQVPAIERTSDGWVGLCAISARQRQDLMCIIGRPDLADAEEIAYSGAAAPNTGAMREALQEWAADMTTETVADLASAIRVPVSPIGTGATLIENEQLKSREFFHLEADGALGVAPAFRFRAAPVQAKAGVVGTPTANRPLDGWKVVDLTAWWAGPVSTQVLAMLGADVVKVESGAKPDGMRLSFVDDPTRERWWEFGPVYYAVNTDKRGVAIDLTTERGKELLTEMVLQADLLVENFTPRVLESLGLDWDRIHAQNPGLVTVRMAAFGHDGPWRDRTGFAQTIEQASGLAWTTGHPDGPPLSPRGVCDPLAGLHAAFAATAAVLHRESTGKGGTVELSMLETAVRATIGQVLSHRRTGEAPQRLGNGAAGGILQNVYRASGADAWVALSAVEADHWREMVRLVDLTALIDGDWGDQNRREAHREEIERAMTKWIGQESAENVRDALCRVGIPAAVVLGAGEVPAHEQFVHRKFFETIEHRIAGTHPVPGPPIRSSTRTHGWLGTPAPVLGEHTDEVLRDWLDLDPKQTAALRVEGVTADAPHTLMKGS